ncbi:MAG: glycerol-3-phosphate dehydrogenase/oxidase [Thermodesulfobacteriota bacterium]
MNRDEAISRIDDPSFRWEIIIIGGGATGLGTALDAASRGYQTLLLEQGDFAQGTSSRSTKLIHGGVRYLQQGNLALIVDALKERGRLLRNAPHLVHNLAFIVPSYDWWEGPFYGIGLKIYDMLAGKEGFGKSEILSREKTLSHIPTIETQGLKCGIIYHDGQFDDARLAVNLAQTAWEYGATLINYMKVEAVTKTSGITSGVIARDLETDREYELKTKALVNATGPFCDEIRKMDDPSSKGMIRPSQGIHIVLDKSFLPGESAVMVPHTDDGRVLFAVPWHDRVIVGTTETNLKQISLEPEPFPEEIDFLLSHASRYLSKDPSRQDILSIFAGIRPLVGNDKLVDTAAISRDHVILISRSGLITITGGKWTTYRKMAEETVDQAEIIGHLEPKPCITHTMRIHGYHENPHQFGEFSIYGQDAVSLMELINRNPMYQEKIHPGSTILIGEIVWAVQNEMARTVEDFLARRQRVLIRDARISLEMAPKTAQVISTILKRGDNWCRDQVSQYSRLAGTYLGHL